MPWAAKRPHSRPPTLTRSAAPDSRRLADRATGSQGFRTGALIFSPAAPTTFGKPAYSRPRIFMHHHNMFLTQGEQPSQEYADLACLEGTLKDKLLILLVVRRDRGGEDLMKEQIAGFEVEHVQGPEEIPYKKDELVVLCLVRDGEPWVRSFIEHYFSLGAKHIVFLDNDSTDDTVSVASEYNNVTLLRTKLPFSASVEGTEGQNLMRRYLIERFGRNRWSLCVDIDELFDYPYSDIIGLDSLL